MRKLLLAAWLLGGASAWASGIEFWVMGGDTLMSNGNLGTSSCYGVAVVNTTQCETVIPGSYIDRYSLGNAWHFGFKGGFNSGEHMGYEVGYTYNRAGLNCKMPSGTTLTSLQNSVSDICYSVINGAYVAATSSSQGMAFHQVNFNALYYFKDSDSRFRPFVTGGLGFTAYAFPGSSAYYGGATNEFAVNYGVGVKYRIGDKWGVRIDARQYATPKPSPFIGSPFSPSGYSQIEFGPGGWLLETEISAGFGILF